MFKTTEKDRCSDCKRNGRFFCERCLGYLSPAAEHDVKEGAEELGNRELRPRQVRKVQR